MYKLGNRVLFRLSGPDSFSFLQGLITADLNLVSGKEARPALFLSSMGNVLSECFVFKHNDEIYLDSLRANYSRILNIVKRRKLASKVNISPIDSDVYVQLPRVSKYLLGYNNSSNSNIKNSYNNNNSSSDNNRSFKENMVKLLDIRGRYFGSRFYNLVGKVRDKDNTNNNNINNNSSGIISSSYTKELGLYEKNLMLNCCILDFLYTRPSYRYLNNSGGSSTSCSSMNNSNNTNDMDHSWFDGLKLMAFDMNLERFNYIGSNKGCYIGQEMVNRVLNKMLINKYVMYLAVNNRVLEMDKSELFDEKEYNRDNMNRLDQEVNDRGEEEELDVLEWFGELSFTKCVNRLMNKNNKLLDKQQHNNINNDRSKIGSKILKEENILNKEEKNNQLSEKQENNKNYKNKCNNNINKTMQHNNNNQNNNKISQMQNNTNNLLMNKELNLINYYGDTYKLVRYLFSNKMESVSLNVSSDKIRKLVDTKKLVFVVFSERFGFVLLNRNLQMKHLNVNGEVYLLEPVF